MVDYAVWKRLFNLLSVVRDGRQFYTCPHALGSHGVGARRLSASLRGQTKRSSNNSHLRVYVSAVGYQIGRPPNPILLHRFRSISIRLVFLMGHGKLAGHPLPPAPQQQWFQGLGDRPRRTHLTDPPPPGPRQGAMLTIRTRHHPVSDGASQTLRSQGGDPQGALLSTIRNREKGRRRCWKFVAPSFAQGTKVLAEGWDMGMTRENSS